ncbi:uncharacterized protein Triagg1_4674 [Trichoderma aggressivum f. europaeum]|uniref:Uncharacterized protein n=1 Tax=Trichoderma aggressivum f. europaeum TaxID=173218 RepID=A0AAE1J763_9HYPO|nr:hypothetical protein Triagg1_4674 [Trichoderma aggressivum f. europaeum]
MPAKTRKRKASEEEGDDVEEVPQPVKKTARKTQKKQVGESSKRSRAGPSNRATNSTLKKSKAASSSSKSAKSAIRRDADSLLHMIEGQYNNARSAMTGNNSLSSKISALLQDGLDTQNIIHQKPLGRIKALQHTLDEYETANRDSIKARKPAEGAQWEQDARDVAKVNKKAMEMSIQMINCLVISGEHATSLKSPPRSDDDVEQAAWRWIEGGIPSADDSWGSSARETLKAFAGVAKLLL